MECVPQERVESTACEDCCKDHFQEKEEQKKGSLSILALFGWLCVSCVRLCIRVHVLCCVDCVSYLNFACVGHQPSFDVPCLADHNQVELDVRVFSRKFPR